MPRWSRIRRPTLVSMVALLLASGVWTGCSARDGGTRTSTAGVDLVQQWKPSERRRVDNFAGRTLAGKRVTAESLDGTVTVVNVWGSWCGPCRAEAPVLRKVAAAYQSQGVRFLGLNVRDNDAAARAFERRYQIPYDSVVSADSPGVSVAFGRLLTTTAVPTTVIVTPDRRIAGRVVGQVSESTLRGMIDDARPSGQETK